MDFSGKSISLGYAWNTGTNLISFHGGYAELGNFSAGVSPFEIKTYGQDLKLNPGGLSAGGNLVINEGGLDSDTRIEASGAPNAFFVDGSNGNVDIGTATPQSLLDVQGPVGTGATGAGILTLATKELTIVDGDELGRINFNAPLESDGSDSILAGAAIWGEADDTFSATVNSTELVFGTETTSAAVERMRIDSAGNVGIGTASPLAKLTIQKSSMPTTLTVAGSYLHIGG